MVIFDTLKQAEQQGYRYYDLQSDRTIIVIRKRPDGLMERALVKPRAVKTFWPMENPNA